MTSLKYVNSLTTFAFIIHHSDQSPASLSFHILLLQIIIFHDKDRGFSVVGLSQTLVLLSLFLQAAPVLHTFMLERSKSSLLWALNFQAEYPMKLAYYAFMAEDSSAFLKLLTSTNIFHTSAGDDSPTFSPSHSQHFSSLQDCCLPQYTSAAGQGSVSELLQSLVATSTASWCFHCNTSLLT